MLARFFSKPFFIAVLLWFFIGVIFYLLLNLLVMPYFAGKFIGKVKVPVLVNLQPEKARDLLRKDALIYMLDSTGDYSNDVGAGRILSQYPVEGTEVKKGRRIWVRISKGLKSVELPPLRGLSLRQAEITLQQLGLKLGRVREIRNTNVPSGAVIGPGRACDLGKRPYRRCRCQPRQGRRSHRHAHLDRSFAQPCEGAGPEARPQNRKSHL